MADRRMFSKTIVMSDVFLDMPLSARCLYFTLGMMADDDGFVGNPKSITRQCGASQEDLDILKEKRYILGFDSGVIVIKHWCMNNYIKKDRYKQTTYIEEMETLDVDNKGAYTEKSGGKGVMSPKCLQNVSKVETQVRLELGKDSINNMRKRTPKKSKTMYDNNRNYTSEEFEEMERDALRG